jgi:hypothetical protein
VLIFPYELVEASELHDAISKCHNHDKSDETAWYTAADEMFDLQITLTKGIFLHDCSYIELEVKQNG